jgi:hypothetical protein
MTMKTIILVLAMVCVLCAAPVYAGVTITITDTASGDTLKSFTISTTKVNNLKAMSEATGKAPMVYLTEAVGDVFLQADKYSDDEQVKGIPEELKRYIIENKSSLCAAAGCP